MKKWGRKKRKKERGKEEKKVGRQAHTTGCSRYAKVFTVSLLTMLALHVGLCLCF